MYKKITTLAAAFKVRGLAPDFVPDVSMWPESMRAHKIIEFNLQMVIMAINGKWEPNWLDTSQRKYYPWWWFISKENGVSGRGLSLSVVDYDVVASAVGPRLVYEDKAKVEHAAKYFLPLYESYYYGLEKAA